MPNLFRHLIIRVASMWGVRLACEMPKQVRHDED